MRHVTSSYLKTDVLNYYKLVVEESISTLVDGMLVAGKKKYMALIQKNLDDFYSWSHQKSIGSFEVESLDRDSFVLRSKDRKMRPPRDIEFSILSLTHGNEVAGIAIQNEILRLIQAGLVKPKIEIAFHLGDVEAAKAGKRFIDADLNRSFNLKNPTNPTEYRAQKLESYFDRSQFLLDLHQTQGPSAEPFFISRYEEASFKIFQTALPQCSAVTYWDQNFSQSGMTTLNYHLMREGLGFAIELGEKGFDPYQIEFGVSAVLKIISVLENRDAIKTVANHNNDQIYTFSHLLQSKSGTFALLPGWKNMSQIAEGQELGSIDGAMVKAPSHGRILFPKYLTANEIGKPGAEVIRILRKVSLAELTRS